MCSAYFSIVTVNAPNFHFSNLHLRLGGSSWLSLFQAYALLCQDCDFVIVFFLVIFLCFHMTELGPYVWPTMCSRSPSIYILALLLMAPLPSITCRCYQQWLCILGSKVLKILTDVSLWRNKTNFLYETLNDFLEGIVHFLWVDVGLTFYSHIKMTDVQVWANKKNLF